jgi:pimeloyl-ACP methyl ester carboxylesterase
MERVAQKRSGIAAVAGAELYYEVRGRGPAVLFIAGATGDAGHFEQAADVLALEHTVITYDRRGNSRSRPTGPSALDQQADDAAALLRHVGAAAAIVFGTSGGAIIALKLAIRAPEVARDVIVHEPPFLQVLPDGAELGRAFQTQVEHALATRGARGAMELFIRENAGSDVFDRLDPTLRERMIANGPSFFDHELAMFMSWVPSETELAGLRVPVCALAGRDNRGHYYYRAAKWLAKALGVDLVEMPGGHAPYLAHPLEFAAALQPLLNRDLNAPFELDAAARS